MKKITSIILLCSLFIFCFSGCLNSNNGEAGKGTSDQEGETTSAPSTDEPSESTSDQKTETSSTPSTDESGESTLSPEEEAYLAALYKTFDTIRADTEKNTKLGFHVDYEQLYYEFKASGQYDNSRWTNPIFEVYIHYVPEEAADEEWYKQCVDKDIKSLNQAFFDQHSKNLSHGKYSNIALSHMIYLIYRSSEDFEKDYAAIKALTDLDYVKEASIHYTFGLPEEYFLE